MTLLGNLKSQRVTARDNVTKLKDDVVTGLKFQHKMHTLTKPEDIQYLNNTVAALVMKLEANLDKYDRGIEKLQKFIANDLDEIAAKDLEKQLLQENDVIESFRSQLIDLKIHLVEIEKRQQNLEPKTEVVTPAQPTLSQQQMIELMTTSMAGIYQAQQQQQATAAAANPPQIKAKLPKFEIPKFTGDMLEWTGFWAQFSSAVDSNRSLQPIEKFTYLRSYLSGEPLKSVDSYAFNPDNYPIVVAYLRDRYGRDSKIVESHFNALHDLPPTTGDSIKLRSFYDTLERHLRILESRDQVIENLCYVSLIKKKLPEDVLREMERLKPRANPWTVALLRQYLKDVVQLSEDLSDSMKSSAASKVSRDVSSFEGSGAYPKNPSGSKPPRPAAQTLVAFEKPQQNRRDCLYCKKSHWMDDCPSFTTSVARQKILKEAHRCYGCLSKDHQSPRQCKVKRPCFHCGKPGHHRSLCFKKFGSPSEPKPPGTNKKGNTNSGLLSDAFAPEKDTLSSHEVKEELLNFPTETVLAHGESILMQTASSPILNPQGSTEVPSIASTIFDTGSTHTYVVLDLAKELHLPLGQKEEIQQATFGNSRVSKQTVFSTDLLINFKDGSQKKITAKVIPQISAPTYRVPYGTLLPSSVIRDIQTFQMADSIPFKPECRAYQLLIGQDYYYDFMLKERLEIPSCPGLHLQNTRLGWIIAGRIHDSNPQLPNPSLFVHSYIDRPPQTEMSFLAVPESALSTSPDMKLFWDVETLGIEQPSDQTDHKEAVQQFNDTVRVVNDRYEVTWPKKLSNPDLPDNYSLAYHRLNSQCKRFKDRPELLQKCDEIIQNQMEKGIIERVTSETEEGPLKHYIPHHAVETPDKLTTKTRIVFDASAKKNKQSLSLNDCLYPGPTLIHELVGLLMRFRFYPIAIVADIEKAFLNIGLQIPDRDVTRFFWFKDPTNPSVSGNVQIYRFCRIPFGVNSSPFLLASTVNHLLESVGSPVALQLRDDIYVDNVITGASDVDSAVNLYEESQTIFKKVSLNLREWSSNSTYFLDKLPPIHRAEGALIKVLGIKWNTNSDYLTITGFDNKQFLQVATKREVLQALASVYDPMGYFSPVTLMAKLFLCSLWVEKFDWDHKLPPDKLDKWSEIHTQLCAISSHLIPRFLGHSPQSGATFHLICFCDASATSYATTVYLRSVLGDVCFVNLQLSKTRLSSPNKKWTIPRLELMAAVVGHRSLNSVARLLHIPITSKTLWSDSQCVLHWIRSTKILSVFIENRVKEIRQSTDITFRYVHMSSNPADFATRGRSVEELSDSIWWHGPSWLRQPEDTWPSWDVPSFDQATLDAISAESRKTPQIMYEVSLFAGEGPSEKEMSTPFGINRHKFSSLSRLYRVTAHCVRFISNCLVRSAWRNRLHRRFHRSIDLPFLSADEVSEARLLWDLAVQHHWYSDIISSMQRGDKPNRCVQLGLQFDDNSVLRCHGRFDNLIHTEAAKHPKLYPSKDHLSKLIIEFYHKSALHSGVSQTLAMVRQQYWIPQGRSRVRLVLSDCRICRHIMGGPYKLPAMAPWPKEKMTQSPPFTFTGLDYFGPLYIKDDQGQEKKVWVCLFTCVAVRAVHLELVYDMSTEEFIRCFRRFVSFRGKPEQLISDNATQFKLAKTTLEKAWDSVVNDSDTQSYIASQGVKWKFIIQFAPWTGGFYERMVGIVKSSLKKSIGTLHLTASQLSTILAEVQAVVNSRPLVYVNEDLNSDVALTPGHFLGLNPRIGIPILSADTDDVDPDFNYLPESSAQSLINSWKTGQKYLEHFWKTWKNSYLLSLREHKQSRVVQGRVKSTDTVKAGDIVLIKDNLPRGSWKLGKIKSLIPSSDGAIRAANILLPSKRTLNRPINLLYPIECPTVVSVPDGVQGSVAPDNQTGQSAQVPVPINRPRRAAAARGREVVQNWVRDMVGLKLSVVPRTIEHLDKFCSDHNNFS